MIQIWSWYFHYQTSLNFIPFEAHAIIILLHIFSSPNLFIPHIINPHNLLKSYAVSPHLHEPKPGTFLYYYGHLNIHAKHSIISFRKIQT
jgi:hypothetical protein